MMVTDADVDVFAGWLDATLLRFTPTEARVLRGLGSRFGTYVTISGLAAYVYGDQHLFELFDSERAAMRNHIMRIRRKLAATPWRIETRHPHGLYRLVHE